MNTTTATFSQPYGIAVGPNNNDLWFTDSGASVLGDAVIIPRLTITPVALPNAPFGQVYATPTNLVAGTASGGTQPYVNWQVATGYSLPAGLSLNASNGVISGTPTGPLGTTDFNLTVMDSNGSPLPANGDGSTVQHHRHCWPTCHDYGHIRWGTKRASEPGFANPLVATVTDSGGNPVPGASVTFGAPTLGPSGTFAGTGTTATVLTNAFGVATSPVFTANAQREVLISQRNGRRGGQRGFLCVDEFRRTAGEHYRDIGWRAKGAESIKLSRILW